jgi:predicted XRE-type DNA-binding protein
MLEISSVGGRPEWAAAIDRFAGRSSDVDRQVPGCENAFVRAFDDPVPALKEQLQKELIASLGMFEQSMAANAIGTDQPRMSDLERGRLERFSLESLIRFLARIERRVELNVLPCPRGTARIFYPNDR